MPRRKQDGGNQLNLLEAKVVTAPCVPAVRIALTKWRESGCRGVTDTTAMLLNYWFKTDHRLPNGQFFRYHDFQREAVETLIYLYEVAGIRRFKDLAQTYAASN